MSPQRPSQRRTRVLRVIARLNVGGPAHHVTILSGSLDPARFETLLLTGQLGPGEGSFENLAARNGARLERIASLGPELNLQDDLKALWHLVRIMRRFRPDIVHTHTAKAGMLGRLAAWIALGRGPVIVHTYHGHVLRGYFGPAKNALFRTIERALARRTDCLIGNSQATVDDLVEMRVAPRRQFRVIPTGLNLKPFFDAQRADGTALREELGVGDDQLLGVYIGRLAPIKRVDVLLDAVAHARALGASLRVVLVGDGELRGDLERQVELLGLGDTVTFLGFRYDLPAIIAASDLALLSSDNEAIPVALIEAAATGRPAISTNVGGVAELITPETGYLVAPGDATAMGECMAQAARERAVLVEMGKTARIRARRFTSERLVGDIVDLYDEMLTPQRGP